MNRFSMTVIALLYLSSLSAQRYFPNNSFVASVDTNVDKHVDKKENILNNEYFFEQVGGLIFVKANFNGKFNGNFILDTGSEEMILNETPNDLSNNFEAVGVNGTTAVEEIPIQHFQFANLELEDGMAYKLDLRHIENLLHRKIDGLIGGVVLEHKELFVDYKQKKIVLFDNQYREHYLDAIITESIPIRMFGHFATIEFKIGGQKFRFALDTGCEVNLIDKKVIAQLNKNYYEVADAQKLLGADQKYKEANQYFIKNMKLPKTDITNSMEFMEADLSSFQGKEDFQLDGILGYPFLKELLFSINLQTKKFYIWSDEITPTRN